MERITKTYERRKKSEETQEVIVELNELCRLCMSKEAELISLYNNDESVPLTLKIMACVALEVFEGDTLPDKICLPCKLQLEKSYNFRKKCEQSDMKLRQHVREIAEKLGTIQNESDHEEIVINDNEPEVGNETNTLKEGSLDVAPCTEEDLVGVAKVTYIQQEPEQNEDPENITLPPETETINKAACTLKQSQMKTEIVEQENDDIFIMEEEEQASMENNNMDAIADAVKATLASQPGLNLSGQLQLKVNQTEGKSTQVEVTTEDGSVIIMELMTEEDAETPKPSIEQIDETNDDGELKIFKCPDCPKSFSRRIQLRRHASVHMQQRGFSCGICEKWFPTRSALIRHERIHTGERPFQCEVCQKSFAQKEILFRHLMTHTGQKPYNCPHCPKGFTQKEPLRLHLRTHVTASGSEIQLHYCTLCPKVFCHASGLSRHLVTHTGKTFKCRVCDKSFTDKSSLRRHHLQTLHHT